MVRRAAMFAGFVLLLALAAGAAGGAASTTEMGTTFTPKDLVWGPAPPALPRGAERAVLEGDPAKPGLFTYRLRLPDGYKVMPHWHSTVEHVTVLEGELHRGMGERFETTGGWTLPVGGFTVTPARMNHFIWTTGTTILQIHGEGPFDIHYVNPADDPRNASAPPK
jgi:hypothetical protein